MIPIQKTKGRKKIPKYNNFLENRSCDYDDCARSKEGVQGEGEEEAGDQRKGDQKGAPTSNANVPISLLRSGV